MRTRAWVAAAAMITLAACGSASAGNTAPAEPEPVQPAPPPTSTKELPRGTDIAVVLNDSLHADRARVGDRFSATVRTPLLTVNGQTVIPEGATITGLVTGVDDSDHDDDPAYLRLNFIRLTIGDANHPFAAEILETDLGAQAGVSVKDAEKSSATAAIAGAVIGAVIGGDLRAALEGASLGAGAGSIIALGTENELLPAGTVLLLRTTAGISLEH